MTDIMGAHFWQSYCNLDIWKKQDTVSGKEVYFLYADGTVHERDSEKGILDLAKFIVKARGGR